MINLFLRICYTIADFSGHSVSHLTLYVNILGGQFVIVGTIHLSKQYVWANTFGQTLSKFHCMFERTFFIHRFFVIRHDYSLLHWKWTFEYVRKIACHMGTYTLMMRTFIYDFKLKLTYKACEHVLWWNRHVPYMILNWNEIINMFKSYFHLYDWWAGGNR